MMHMLNVKEVEARQRQIFVDINRDVCFYEMRMKECNISKIIIENPTVDLILRNERNKNPRVP